MFLHHSGKIHGTLLNSLFYKRNGGPRVSDFPLYSIIGNCILYRSHMFLSSHPATIVYPRVDWVGPPPPNFVGFGRVPSGIFGPDLTYHTYVPEPSGPRSGVEGHATCTVEEYNRLKGVDIFLRHREEKVRIVFINRRQRRSVTVAQKYRHVWTHPPDDPEDCTPQFLVS